MSQESATSIRVLGLSLFGRRGASSRYRLYQYVPHLRKRGIHVDVRPLIGDSAYSVLLGIRRTNRLVRPLLKLFLVLRSMAARLFHVLGARPYDLVFIQKDVLPSAYLLILRLMRKKVIFDLDDALFERHPTIRPSPLSLDRLFFELRKRSLDRVLSQAAAVTVTTPYLEEYVKKLNPEVHVITGPIDCDATGPVEVAPHSGVVIGWIGSPVTTKFVTDILESLRDVQACHEEVSFDMVGAREFSADGLDLSFLEWSEENELAHLSRFDIGIMPLPIDNWSKGKGGLKILQYFAMGIPVVCSPVGINAELVTDGETGFLARDRQEWVEKLSTLVRDEELRRRMGKAGRDLVRARYDLKDAVDRMEIIVRRVVMSSKGAGT
jgi:glycosyltransferase involved in cell wall biosynthesis